MIFLDKLFKWPAGIKKTKQRESLISILQNSTKPLSALEIYTIMKKQGDKIWLSTVYRIIENFLQNNIVLKSTLADSETALYELNRFEHKHYAVCIKCHKIIPIYNCPMEQFIPELSAKDFHVVGHKLEIFGYCKDCYEQLKKVN